MPAYQQPDAGVKPPVALAPRRSTRVTRLGFLILAPIVFLAILGTLSFVALWYVVTSIEPIGFGEGRESPDGRYEASVYRMEQRTPIGTLDRFVQFEVVERSGGRQIWHVVQRYAPDVDPPRYEMRGRRFVEWAADSKSVSIPVTGGQTMTFDVP